MHDKVFAKEIKSAVEEKLKSLGKDMHVSVINVRLSPFSHVKSDSLKQAFLIEAEGSELKNIPLNVLPSEVEIECNSCTNKFSITSPIFSCPKCRGADLKIKQGLEFFVESIETEG